ncbi:MAG TPA: M67 family metallopeptidase [Terriglobales bacterium]
MLKIRKTELEEMRRHAEIAYPEECCGVLIGGTEGEARVVERAVRCRNAAKNGRRRRYEIDPRELIQIQREAREQKLHIVGFYHSHPDHAAEWSATDLRDAYWAGCSYVIVGVKRGKAAEVRSFVLADSGDGEGGGGRFIEETIDLV